MAVGHGPRCGESERWNLSSTAVPTISMTTRWSSCLVRRRRRVGWSVLPDLDVLLDRTRTSSTVLSSSTIGRCRPDRRQGHRSAHRSRDFEPFPNDPGEVVNLLAALVATGMIEPRSPERATQNQSPRGTPLPESEAQRRTCRSGRCWRLLGASGGDHAPRRLVEPPPRQVAEVAPVEVLSGRWLWTWVVSPRNSRGSSKKPANMLKSLKPVRRMPVTAARAGVWCGGSFQTGRLLKRPSRRFRNHS